MIGFCKPIKLNKSDLKLLLSYMRASLRCNWGMSSLVGASSKDLSKGMNSPANLNNKKLDTVASPDGLNQNKSPRYSHKPGEEEIRSSMTASLNTQIMNLIYKSRTTTDIDFSSLQELLKRYLDELEYDDNEVSLT